MARKHAKSFQSTEEFEPLDGAAADGSLSGEPGEAGDPGSDTGEESAAG